MNAITKALSDIKFRIPKPILRDTFLPRTNYFGNLQNTAQSLDSMIRSKVIDARVVPDCNLVGGSETVIYIGDIRPRVFEQHKMVWSIPMERTENRSIIRVHHLIFGTYSMHGSMPQGFNSSGGGAFAGAVQKMLGSVSEIPNNSDHNIELVGENTVMAYNQLVPSDQLYLRCVLENDSEMGNLPPSALAHFSQLVEYAVKSYIYNTMILEVDEGRLSGGSELGRYTSIIEQYSDAEENYKDYFQTKWRKVAHMADPEARKRQFKRISGGGIS